MELDLSQMNKVDHLKRMVEKESGKPEYSPMDPPDAYKPPKLDQVPYEQQHPVIQKLSDEHKAALERINKFEDVIQSIQGQGIDKDAVAGITEFFHFFDHKILEHNQKEDKALFPFLQKRLLELGEHSESASKVTAVDMMQADHIKALQLAAVSFNVLGLASRLPDAKSRLVALDVAIEQSRALIELLKLHIFREENIVFPLAHKFMKKEEFDLLEK